MTQPTTIYMTDSGYRNFKESLESKRAEHKKVFEARTEAMQGRSEGDMNDPEIVHYQQTEVALNATIKEMQDIISKTKIIVITDEMRDLKEVRIGSLVALERYNETLDKQHPTELWEITGYDETNLKEKRLAYNSPLAQAILGAKVGEVLEGVKINNNEFDITIKGLYKNLD